MELEQEGMFGPHGCGVTAQMDLGLRLVKEKTVSAEACLAADILSAYRVVGRWGVDG